jgi:hypothetical protein
MAVLEGKFKDGDHIIVEANAAGHLTFRTAEHGSPVEVG